MKRSCRVPAYLVVTGLLAAGAVAGSAAVASAGTIGSCTAKGNAANCAAAAKASNPRTLALTVTSSPDQTVFVAWNDTCSQGGKTVSSSGHFIARTPLSRTIPHPFTQPPLCIVAAAAQLSGSGTVRVSLSSSSAAPAVHQIKGYAGFCADDAGNSTALRNKIDIWKCNGSAAQQWTFSHGELIHRGMCMNDKPAGGSGSPVVLYKCTGAANELWSHNSHGEYVLKAHNGTLCLADPAFSKRNGTALVVSTCHGTANQRWTLP